MIDFEERRDELLEKIEEMTRRKQYKALRDILVELEPADIADLFDDLPEEMLPLLFRLLPKEPAAELFVELEPDVQEMLIRGFSNTELKEVLDELYLDDAVDIVEEMPAGVVKRILKHADPDTRKSINEILKYPEDSAGALMTTEFVDLKRDMTVEDALKRIRRTGTDKETINVCYVVDPARKEKLNALRFKSLHYTNSLGTDLTIALPDDHLWAAGNSETPAGVGFVANLPTEEIFTAPLRTGINGTVCAALPLVNNGSIIEDIRFTVREGRIVEAKASRGEDVLNAAIAVDDGARYFGEVALVPYDSPIRSSGLLFYNTLYDENASCHLAFGEAYPECIAGGERMTREELVAHGLNHSLTHVDFMVGTADLSITGTTHDGRELPVFRSGNFAL